MDDEEPSTPWIKQEAGSVPIPKAAPKPPSLTSEKAVPPPTMSGKQSHPSRKTSTSSTITLASRPKVAAKLTKKPSSSTSSTSQPKPKKRRRSLEDELDSELSDLETFTPIPHKRTRRSIGSNIDVNTSDIRQKFHFKAITDYSADGSCHYLLSSDPEDIVETCELWDHVKLVVDSWEEAKGDFWAYEFEDKMRGRESKCCVSSKLRVEGRPTGRTMWRREGEGKFACKKCVEENVPCFTWDGEGDGEEGGFRLLPLHPEDRDERWPLKEGFEVRYWVNGE